MKAPDFDPVVRRDHPLACYVDIMRDEKPLRVCTADVTSGRGIAEVHDENGLPKPNPERTAIMTHPYTFDCIRLRRDAKGHIREYFAEFAAYFKDSPVRFEA